MDITEIITAHDTVDWHDNKDIHNKIAQDIDDMFYELERKPVKNINLRIKADRTVFVSAAEDVSEKIIDKFLLSKAEYICSALKYYEEIEKYSPKSKQYIDGETFKIFGREQRLIVREGKKNSVMSDEAYITLTVKNLSDFALKKKTMDK